MRKYVVGCRPRKPDPARVAENWQEFDVGYSASAEWSLPSLGEAEIELGVLERLRVHVGLHFCTLAIEHLPDDLFAIICTDHPGPPV